MSLNEGRNKIEVEADDTIASICLTCYSAHKVFFSLCLMEKVKQTLNESNLRLTGRVIFASPTCRPLAFAQYLQKAQEN